MRSTLLHLLLLSWFSSFAHCSVCGAIWSERQIKGTASISVDISIKARWNWRSHFAFLVKHTDSQLGRQHKGVYQKSLQTSRLSWLLWTTENDARARFHWCLFPFTDGCFLLYFFTAQFSYPLKWLIFTFLLTHLLCNQLKVDLVKLQCKYWNDFWG